MNGDQILLSTWDFKVKHFLYSILQKLKYIFYERGNIQVKGLDHFEKYSPVVSWTTVKPMLILRINQGWATIQVDFYNDFVQSNLVEYIYLILPNYFDSKTSEDRENSPTKINKSIYGLVQALLY